MLITSLMTQRPTTGSKSIVLEKEPSAWVKASPTNRLCALAVPLRVSQKFTGHLEQIRAALIIQEKEVGKNKGATGEVRTPVWGKTPRFL